jgi:hypothetical protein
MNIEIEYDKSLWFHFDGCKGRHYLIGNPHTYPGRIWAWCPHEACTFFVSKSSMTKMSVKAEFWIKGFLCGSEPAPPVNKNGEVNFSSKAFLKWKEKTEAFYETGIWK